MKTPPVVKVTWNDAWCSQAGHSVEAIAAEHEPHVVSSVGFLVRSDRKGVMIAGCYDEKEGEPYYDRILFVPRGMVAKVRRVR
jgi:hypothetical protein